MPITINVFITDECKILPSTTNQHRFR